MPLVPVPLVEAVLMCEEFTNSLTPMTVLRQKLITSPSVTEDVAKLTVGQRTNSLWASIRKLRLTASNYGPIIHALNTKRWVYIFEEMYFEIIQVVSCGIIKPIY